MAKPIMQTMPQENPGALCFLVPKILTIMVFQRLVGWLLGRLTSPCSTKIGYIGDKVLGGELVLPG